MIRPLASLLLLSAILSASSPTQAQSTAQSATACRAGDATACRVAGDAVTGKGNPAQDLPLAREMYERACNLGDKAGCTLSGQLWLSNGRGLSPDYAKGLALLEKGCTMKEGYACHLLGSAHLAGSTGLRADRERGIVYMKRACESPREGSCDVLHNLLVDEMPPRQARAKEVAESWGKACEAGLVSTCARATVYAFDGNNGDFPQAVDWQLADRNALAGCKNRVIQSCVAGEKIFSNPERDTYDASRGHMYSDAACRLDSGPSCYNKAWLLIADENYADVAASFAKACKLGQQAACKEAQSWQAYDSVAGQLGARDAGRRMLLDRAMGFGEYTNAFYVAINDWRSIPLATWVFERANKAGRMADLREIDLVAYGTWTGAPSAYRVQAEREAQTRLDDRNRRNAAAEAERRAALARQTAPTRYVGSLGPNYKFLVCRRDASTGLCDYKVQDGL